jgi:hypothetical protein
VSSPAPPERFTVTLTVEEAAAWLHPQITAAALGQIVKALQIEPYGTRRKLTAGRPAATYRAGELMRLHARLAPWLPVTPRRPARGR